MSWPCTSSLCWNGDTGSLGESETGHWMVEGNKDMVQSLHGRRMRRWPNGYLGDDLYDKNVLSSNLSEADRSRVDAKERAVCSLYWNRTRCYPNGW